MKPKADMFIEEMREMAKRRRAQRHSRKVAEKRRRLERHARSLEDAPRIATKH